MNKYLISEGGAQIGAHFVLHHGGFIAGQHEEPLVGYFAKRSDSTSEEWNSMGHGLTYDLALSSLYFLTTKGELPPSRDYFTKTRFYLESN